MHFGIKRDSRIFKCALKGLRERKTQAVWKTQWWNSTWSSSLEMCEVLEKFLHHQWFVYHRWCLWRVVLSSLNCLVSTFGFVLTVESCASSLWVWTNKTTSKGSQTLMTLEQDLQYKAKPLCTFLTWSQCIIWNMN